MKSDTNFSLICVKHVLKMHYILPLKIGVNIKGNPITFSCIQSKMQILRALKIWKSLLLLLIRFTFRRTNRIYYFKNYWMNCSSIMYLIKVNHSNILWIRHSVPLEYQVCLRLFQYYFYRIARNISCYDDNKKDKHFVNANSRGHTEKSFS